MSDNQRALPRSDRPSHTHTHTVTTPRPVRPAAVRIASHRSSAAVQLKDLPVPKAQLLPAGRFGSRSSQGRARRSSRPPNHVEERKG